MDLRLDIERRKRFAGKERDYRREGARSPGGSRGPSREKSSEKSGKHHKKSKYVESPLGDGGSSQSICSVCVITGDGLLCCYRLLSIRVSQVPDICKTSLALV